MTYYVSSGTLNHTYRLTQEKSAAPYVTKPWEVDADWRVTLTLLILPGDECRGYMWNKIISAFADVRLKYFRLKLFQNYFRGSWIFYNMFNVAEIILK